MESESLEAVMLEMSKRELKEMKFIDLDRQYSLIKADIDRRIKEVLESGQYICGPALKELEKELAKFAGVKHVIGVSSGTDALLMALMALNIQPGDEVITTPFSFMATAETILLLGAKPVFVDIDLKTYNIDTSKIKAAITKRTKAIMPVNLYGQCADFDRINEIALTHNLSVIEDGAQSLGATYRKKRSCGLGTIGCTSFYPAKPLGCYGDGGACFTNDDSLAEKIRWILNHGQDRGYYHRVVGINGRLDTIQAAILLAKLSIFQDELQKRETVAKWYHVALKNKIITPYVEPYNHSVWAQYTIRVENRESFQKQLKEAGIPTAVHYPLPIYRQPVFEKFEVDATHFPMTEKAAKEVVSLPFHPYMSREEVHHVADVVAC